jgi:PAS domain S-box-containing protein
VVVVDQSGTIVLFNRAAEDLFQYRSDEIVGTSISRLVPDDVRRRHGALVEGFVVGAGDRRLMAANRDFVAGIRSDGSHFPAAITVGPIDLGSGEKLAMAAVRDQSAIVGATEQLKQTSAELASRNEELQQFLMSASHDLREPLRKVRTFAGELAEALPEDLDEWAAMCLDRTIDAGDRMWVLLDELIGYARLMLQERNIEPCPLTPIVEEAVEDLSLLMNEAGAEIDIGALPEVAGDRVLLRQLFHNLLANAIKFARQGSPPHIQVREAASHSRVVVVDVDDNGIGIEPGYEERAFEPFRRLHHISEIQGSGMGLTICRKVAQLHGGDVRANPNPAGAGTRMRVTLARSAT